jgi:hypothetical protein
MRRLVIDLFDPGPKAGIEIAQVAQAGGIELTQELITEGPVPAFMQSFA